MSKIKNSKRSYLSWSQLSCYEYSPDEYYRRYVLGEPGFENDAMRFGKGIAEALELGQSEDPEVRLLISLLPSCELKEQEIRAKYKDIELLAKPDTHDKDFGKLREYKTGRNRWTQEKVNKHGQLDFYASVIYLNEKKIPLVHLDWIPTEYDENGFLKLAGGIHSFERKITIKDIAKMLSRIEKSWHGIQELWK